MEMTTVKFETNRKTQEDLAQSKQERILKHEQDVNKLKERITEIKAQKMEQRKKV